MNVRSSLVRQKLDKFFIDNFNLSNKSCKCNAVKGQKHLQHKRWHLSKIVVHLRKNNPHKSIKYLHQYIYIYVNQKYNDRLINLV